MLTLGRKIFFGVAIGLSFELFLELEAHWHLVLNLVHYLALSSLTFSHNYCSNESIDKEINSLKNVSS